MSEIGEKIRQKAIALIGCGYIYGATGWICTWERLDEQAAQYPQFADLIYRYGPGWIGKPCYDCAQLTKAAARAVGVYLPDGADNQWRAQQIWREKGSIQQMPDEAGLFLFTVKGGRATHAAVSIGGGEAVDARGHAFGVVRRIISQASYTHYARSVVDN